ncbi:MAG: hypothetical protein BWY06_01824 [Candidatus Latescibacteria bacterium ADurb.Bin168]|nr:MAG: hypothetical protein BWY06_01824 [Candidatus Latescibacteria bacterium ADurb.Bin168]
MPVPPQHRSRVRKRWGGHFCLPTAGRRAAGEVQNIPLVCPVPSAFLLSAHARASRCVPRLSGGRIEMTAKSRCVPVELLERPGCGFSEKTVPNHLRPLSPAFWRRDETAEWLPPASLDSRLRGNDVRFFAMTSTNGALTVMTKGKSLVVSFQRMSNAPTIRHSRAGGNPAECDVP